MIIEAAQFNSLQFAKVDRVVPGIGSFINIFLKRSNEAEEFQIWVYLCEWAITKDGEEVVSSDVGEDISKFDFSRLFSNTSFLRIEVLDVEELHLLFSKGIVVEVWGNKSLYGADSEMLILYKDGEPLTAAVLGSSSSGDMA